MISSTYVATGSLTGPGDLCLPTQQTHKSQPRTQIFSFQHCRGTAASAQVCTASREDMEELLNNRAQNKQTNK